MFTPRLSRNSIWLGALIFFIAGDAHGEESWRFDAALTVSRFEQQIKTEIGGARGERLVEESLLGLSLTSTHRIWGALSAGLFARYDSAAGGQAGSRVSSMGERSLRVKWAATLMSFGPDR